MTVQEMDRPGEQCKLLKTWRTPDGSKAYLVQAVDTMELITVVETDATPMGGVPAGAHVRAVSTRIYHWGRGATAAPKGTPAPPEDALVLGKPLEAAAPKEEVVKAPPAKPEPPAAVASNRRWPPAFATKPGGGDAELAKKNEPRPAPAVVVGPDKSPAVVRSNDAKTADGSVTGPEIKPSRPTIVKAGDDAKTPSGPAPFPVVVQKSDEKPAKSTDPVVVRTGEPKSPPAAPKSAEGKPTPPAPIVVMGPDPTPGDNLPPWMRDVKKPAAEKPLPATPPVKVETTPPQPSNWKESWGKVDSPTPVPPKPEAPKVVAALPKVDVPRADAKHDDPLKDPERYARNSKSNDTPKPSPKPPAAPAELAAKAPAATIDRRPDETTVLPTKTDLPKEPATLDRQPEIKAPMGVAKKPVEAPAVQPPPGPALPPSIAAAAIPADEGNAFSPPVAKTPKTPDAANAFSPAAPAKPPVEAAANAFPTPAPPATAVTGMAYTPTPPPVIAASCQQMVDDGSGLVQILGVLHDSLYPSQREWAAERLAAYDWQRQPAILDSLVAVAKTDPAASVRAECLRSLGRMKANRLDAVAAARSLKTDADPQVRQEAEEILATFSQPVQK
jgi:hypothetical protein